MPKLQPSMRLKVQRDTFFLPDPSGGVYFRNNNGSFRMEGKSIAMWIEQLMPVFDGHHTLDNMVEGLPGPYQDRIYEIAEVLYQNDFVRDVSQDRPHQLTAEVLTRFASQIEFIDHFTDSGAFRFQTVRETQVLAVGSGPVLLSLVSALLDAGMPKLNVLITDTIPTHRQRLVDLVAHAQKTDAETTWNEVVYPPRMGMGPRDVADWREIVRPFHSVLYVSQTEEREQLCALHAACKDEKKVFLPAIFAQQVGMVGPLVHHDAEGCWESAWRRIHASAIRRDPQLHDFSVTAGALLANVMVFEWFKWVAGIDVTDRKSQKSQFYLLNLETMEGDWHPFLPHPLVAGQVKFKKIPDLERQLERQPDHPLVDSANVNASNGLLPFFGEISSAVTGIFHRWEEGDLKQLPLAQCHVQVANPLSEGPAELLPDSICTGITHEEARREAGLCGLEVYLAQIVDGIGALLHLDGSVESTQNVRETVGIGVGESISEAVCRGLQMCLDEALHQQVAERPAVDQVELQAVQDDACTFYVQALATLQRHPTIGLGEEVHGFPVAWVGTRDGWFGSVGLNLTLASRQALQQALLRASGQAITPTTRVMEAPSVKLNDSKPHTLILPACEQPTSTPVLRHALGVLKREHQRIEVGELELESALEDGPVRAFRVCLSEEGCP